MLPQVCVRPDFVALALSGTSRNHPLKLSFARCKADFQHEEPSALIAMIQRHCFGGDLSPR